MHDTHFVTVKAAIYSNDDAHVLAMKLLADGCDFGYGLPGGHIDKDEIPDDALIRELKEELNLTIDTLRRKDFFIHANGKIVLAYIGTATLDVKMLPSHPDQEIGVWKTRREFEALDIDAEYKKFVRENWPS